MRGPPSGVPGVGRLQDGEPVGAGPREMGTGVRGEHFQACSEAPYDKPGTRLAEGGGAPESVADVSGARLHRKSPAE